MKKMAMLRYALFGGLFGLLFPLAATLLRLYEFRRPLAWDQMVWVQGGDPLLWVIDTAPLFLGLFAWFAGYRQVQVLQLNRELDRKVEELTQVAQELRGLQAGLEEHIQERTQATAAIGEVSRRLSSVLEVNQLVKEVVELLKSAFDYYHAHIYLFDENQEHLVVVGGTGEAGQVMLERGHRIARGKGLVGKAAETNAPVFVQEVKNDPSWLPNPLLPNTQSEVAVPIALGRQVLGVLDVQHNVPGGLRPVDVEVLQSVASQVAIALQNARLIARLQQRADQEALVNRVGQKLQGTATIDELLQVAIQELGQAVGVQRAAVELGGLRSFPVPHQPAAEGNRIR